MRSVVSISELSAGVSGRILYEFAIRARSDSTRASGLGTRMDYSPQRSAHSRPRNGQVDTGLLGADAAEDRVSGCRGDGPVGTGARVDAETAPTTDTPRDANGTPRA